MLNIYIFTEAIFHTQYSHLAAQQHIGQRVRVDLPRKDFFFVYYNNLVTWLV